MGAQARLTDILYIPLIGFSFASFGAWPIYCESGAMVNNFATMGAATILCCRRRHNIKLILAKQSHSFEHALAVMRKQRRSP